MKSETVGVNDGLREIVKRMEHLLNFEYEHQGISVSLPPLESNTFLVTPQSFGLGLSLKQPYLGLKSPSEPG